MALHILKLCVGIDSVEQLETWQAKRLREGAADLRHLTRHVPRRADEIVGEGSLYWIIKGFVQVRQRIVRIERLDAPIDQKQCAFVFAPELVRTELQARRPHQGWRYLNPEDAPADLPADGASGDLPPEMLVELRNLGLL